MPRHQLARHARLGLTVALATLVAGASLRAQVPSGRGGTGSLPLATTRTVAFETSEGTWMSLDVSPDGRTIIFDLVGDLYTMPITGGTATRLTSGPGMDAQPRFSPDGRRIVFVSDRAGTENLWVMDADGRNARVLTRGDYNHFVSPVWTPDGEYIAVSRNVSQNVAFTDVFDLYLYHIDGGSGLRLIAAEGAPAAGGRGGGGRGGGGGSENQLGPVFGKDPRFVYYSRKANGWGYNLQFPGWQVAMYDRETGRTSVRTAAFGSGMRPALSPDGKWLVYATRIDTSTALRIRDLQLGDEHTLLANVQRDDQESRFTRDLMPGYAFTPDGRALILSHSGKFWRAEVPSGRQTPIPFTAQVEQQLGPLVKFATVVNDSALRVQQIRDARPSPDGKQLVFSALDRLWIMDLPNGTPRRLTPGTDGEFQPAWSPDGRFIAYVTWGDKTGGGIYRIAPTGGTPEKLTARNAFYQRVAFTPDGTRIVTIRAPRQARAEEARNLGEELVWLPATGGDVTTITSVNGAHDPHFVGKRSDRVYIYDGGVLQSMRFDGTEEREHLRVAGFTQQTSGTAAPAQQPTEMLMSPDGRHAITTVTSNIFIVTVPQLGGATPTISVANPANATVPVKRVTRIGGDFINWSADGSTFHYSLGHSFFIARTAPVVAATRDSATTALADPTRVDVAITVPRDKPSGVLALVGARIVTMKGGEVIDRGTIVVRDNRIAAVGREGAVQIPAGARRIDVNGATIMPGIVDVHAHMASVAGVHRTRSWAYEMNLAYGVTTTRNPQTGNTDILTYSDRVETGDLVGPRVYSTGPGIFSQENIRSLEDARDVLRRYSEFYNTKTIKEYELSPRSTRQYVIMAARELGLMPTTEGSLDLKMNITELLDGYPGHEHAYPIYPLYKDVVQLVAQSGIAYTPTLLVQYGGPWNENYWYERYDISADPKMRRFMPPYDLSQRAQRRAQWFREDQYVFRQYAEQAKKIMDAGGLVAVGGHGQLQGLGVHWELWSIASGGFTPHEALRIATINGAEAIGLSKDLGSLEVGKLADLNVLDRNPLADIRNTVALRYVMKNGRLYDANTLSEVWPRTLALEPGWWVNEATQAGSPRR